MNEEQTKHEKITPALKDAGWDTLPLRLALEQQVAPGRVEHDGRSHKPERADYVLMDGNPRLAVVEAKSDEKSVDAGETRDHGDALLRARDIGRRCDRGAVSEGVSQQREPDADGTHDFAEALDG